MFRWEWADTPKLQEIYPSPEPRNACCRSADGEAFEIGGTPPDAWTKMSGRRITDVCHSLPHAQFVTINKVRYAPDNQSSLSDSDKDRLDTSYFRTSYSVLRAYGYVYDAGQESGPISRHTVGFVNLNHLKAFDSASLRNFFKKPTCWIITTMLNLNRTISQSTSFQYCYCYNW